MYKNIIVLGDMGSGYDEQYIVSKLINSLIKKCKYLILGGGVANTFLKSNKFNIGKSIYEKKQLSNVIKIQKEAIKNNCLIVLPEDLVVSENKTTKEVSIYEVKKNHQIFDLG